MQNLNVSVLDTSMFFSASNFPQQYRNTMNKSSP